MPKIVVMGAGSAVFGVKMIRDIVLTPALQGARLALADTNRKALEVMASIATRAADARSFQLEIEATTDRGRALEGADYVVICVAKDKDRLWKLDFSVPMKHGLRHTVGENGGVGGVFHTLRSVWLVMEIARDIERLAPYAWVLNFTNPMGRVCLAMSSLSKLRVIGLCTGLTEQRQRLGEFLDIPVDQMKLVASGLNHFAWIHEMERLGTGEDLYSALRKKLADAPDDFAPLCRFLFETFGLFPSPSDREVGEYVPYATEFTPPRDIKRFDTGPWKKARSERLAKIAAGQEPLDEMVPPTRSGDRAMKIIGALETGEESVEEAVNIPNRGYVPGLEDDVIVEVPARVSRAAADGLQMPRLPEGVLAMLQAQADMQRMTVEAAMEGNKDLALQAALVDPAVTSARAAKAAFDELFELEADQLPQFA